MRMALAFGILIVVAGPAIAQKTEGVPKSRFGIEADLDTFPQATAKDALRSVLKAADAKRFDYLVAQLAEPEHVDKQVKERGSFEKFVDVVKMKWTEDPESIKELRRFLSDGVWEETADTATVKLKNLPVRQVFLKKIGNRWYLENRTKAQP